MRLESANSLDPDTLATGYSDASLTPSSAPGCERTLVLASIEHAGQLQSPVRSPTMLDSVLPSPRSCAWISSSAPRFRSVIARGTSGRPRTCRLASPLAQRVADRTLALAILGLDVGYLAAEPTRRPPQPRARCLAWLEGGTSVVLRRLTRRPGDTQCSTGRERGQSLVVP